MDKTTRLLRLMQLLRSHRQAVTAQALAQALGVSVRTVYRDIQALVQLGATIDGSAGVGYLLRSGFFLPPLMFSDEEIEALVLGARWVQGQGDGGLTRAADQALGKIASAAPAALREKIAEIGLYAPRLARTGQPDTSPLSGLIREGIRSEHKLQLHYLDAAGQTSARLVWPIALGYFEGRRVLAAWCELRGDFRHFRIDRMQALAATGQRYPQPRRTLVRAWKAARQAATADRI